jgi:hypothetical protein
VLGGTRNYEDAEITGNENGDGWRPFCFAEKLEEIKWKTHQLFVFLD